MSTSVTTEALSHETELPVESGEVMTAADLLAASDDGQLYELIDGVKRAMSPAGNKHGKSPPRSYASLEHTSVKNKSEPYTLRTLAF